MLGGFDGFSAGYAACETAAVILILIHGQITSMTMTSSDSDHSHAYTSVRNL